jgi:uncharacterized protein YdeI (YjbR/CyaY-like superfamily)
MKSEATETMNGMNPRVDFYFRKAQKWQDEIKKLRSIVLACELTEELKWGVPCYTLAKSNIALIHTFKEYCALLFFKGALFQDADGVLIQQTENSQAARQIRFTSAGQIAEMEAIVKAYIAEAIEVEKAGLEVSFKKTTEFTIPEEFQKQFDEIPELKIAFDALTPGRQKAYLLHFSAPKQAKTRVARIEKARQKIFEGKGLNDE